MAMVLAIQIRPHAKQGHISTNREGETTDEVVRHVSPSVSRETLRSRLSWRLSDGELHEKISQSGWGYSRNFPGLTKATGTRPLETLDHLVRKAINISKRKAGRYIEVVVLVKPAKRILLRTQVSSIEMIGECGLKI